MPDPRASILSIDPARPLFIAGATGPTASRLVRRLASEGHPLRLLLRDPADSAQFGAAPQLKFIEGDLSRPEALRGAAEGCAALLHLAHIGLAAPALEICATSGVDRFVCLSSTRRFTQFPEETARRVIEGEARVEASALNYTILRPAMIYGAERDNNVERLIGWISRRPWLPLVRGGRNLVQPIHSDDVIGAILAALKRPAETSRRALTIAGPAAITWKEMAETIARALGRPLRWLPAPYPAVYAAAALAELLPGRAAASRAMVRRLLEDKAFDIAPARGALGPAWAPRDFATGVAQKIAEAAASGRA